MTLATAPPVEAAPDELRDELHSWVAENWSLDITVREWWRRLADAGLSAPSWPAPFGRGYSGAQARIVTEELAAVGAIAPPQGVGLMLGGPTVLDHGSDEQRNRLLPPLLRGEEAWCQLFSEPGAGSDLAGLATRAVADGDGWVVNGQKVWNSSADIARRAVLMARTDPDVPKHAGISFFILDMDQPGIDARPLRQMSGESEFCEVFITDAVVHRADLLEGPGDGWRVAQTTMRYERAGVAVRPARGLTFLVAGEKAGNLDRSTGEAIGARTTARAHRNALPARVLIALARERGVNTDPVMRQRLAGYYTLNEVNRITGLRARALAAQRQPMAAAAQITKLSIAHICHTSRDLAWSILGADATLWGADAPQDGELQVVGLSSFGTSIGGGTDEIQRNLLGERVLGLPREPQTDKDVPYRDLLVGTQRRTPDA